MEIWEGAGSWYYIAQGVCYGIILIAAIVSAYEVIRKNRKR